MTQASSKTVIPAGRTGHDFGWPYSAAVKAGGLIYVSGLSGTDPSGRIVSGDIKAQTTQLLDNMAATLEAAGSSLANAASVIVHIRSASDFPAMNQVYAARWPSEPPARTTVVVLKPLTLPDALVEMSVVAVPTGAERRVVHPADWVKSPNPYSYGIKTGDTLFMSGLLSRSGKDNTAVKGDVPAQTRVVLENGAAILDAAGMSYADVVSARVFLRDGAAFDEMTRAYRPFFPEDPPARATVATGLTAPDYLVEITMVAVKDPNRAAIGPAKGAASRYSTAMRAGNRLFVSGVLAAPGKSGAASQTADALAQIRRTLESAGFTTNDVVDVIMYLSDMSAVAEMNRAYREVFPDSFPARTIMGADVIAPDAVVEIMLTAAK